MLKALHGIILLYCGPEPKLSQRKGGLTNVTNGGSLNSRHTQTQIVAIVIKDTKKDFGIQAFRIPPGLPACLPKALQ
jgi:hypothetical protein